MTNEQRATYGRASPALRDRFLRALDADDYTLLRELAGELRGCIDMLPRRACMTLGLPRGSTYGTAADAIVAP